MVDFCKFQIMNCTRISLESSFNSIGQPVELNKTFLVGPKLTFTNCYLLAFCSYPTKGALEIWVYTVLVDLFQLYVVSFNFGFYSTDYFIICAWNHPATSACNLR